MFLNIFNKKLWEGNYCMNNSFSQLQYFSFNTAKNRKLKKLIRTEAVEGESTPEGQYLKQKYYI
jgi:hypothetical protein